MYQEICRDLIYIELHLLLYKSIINNLIDNNIKLHYMDRCNLEKILDTIVDNHFKQYVHGLECNKQLLYLSKHT